MFDAAAAPALGARPSGGGRDGEVTGLRLELLDDAGNVLSSAAVQHVMHAPCGGSRGGCQGCGPRTGGCRGGSGGMSASDPNASGTFEAYVQDDDRTVAVRLVLEDEEVWSVSAPVTPPQVNELTIEHSEGQMRVRWDVTTETEEPFVALRVVRRRGPHVVRGGPAPNGSRMRAPYGRDHRPRRPAAAGRFGRLLHRHEQCGAA